MRSLETIVVATDFGKSAEDACLLSTFLAKAFDSKLIIAHVIPEARVLPGSEVKVEEEAGNRLRDVEAGFRARGAEDVESQVLVGVPFHEVSRIAVIRGANVIMVGSGDEEGTTGAFLGVTARRLVRQSHVPVWVVKRGSRPKIGRILCPVDCSAASARALRNAIELARTVHAELIVANVVRSIPHLYAGDEVLDVQVHSAYAEKKQLALEEFLANFDLREVESRKIVREGSPHREILALADRTRPDLIVMGTVGKSALRRVLMGSVAERVIRRLPCSVVTVRDQDAIHARLHEEISDIRATCDNGWQLLDQGSTREALGRFQWCVLRDSLCAPAWDGLAAVHSTLGDEKEAERCKEQARRIREKIWDLRSG